MPAEYRITFWPEEDGANPYFVFDTATGDEVGRYPTEADALAAYRELINPETEDA